MVCLMRLVPCDCRRLNLILCGGRLMVVLLGLIWLSIGLLLVIAVGRC